MAHSASMSSVGEQPRPTPGCGARRARRHGSRRPCSALLRVLQRRRECPSAAQQAEADDERERQQEHDMDPDRRLVGDLDIERERHDDEAGERGSRRRPGRRRCRRSRSRGRRRCSVGASAEEARESRPWPQRGQRPREPGRDSGDSGRIVRIVRRHRRHPDLQTKTAALGRPGRRRSIRYAGRAFEPCAPPRP